MKIEFLVTIIVLVSVGDSKITKKGKGYSGIHVAIHKSIPEDVQLIDKIKAIFQNASSLLYKATSSQAFFRDITVVVPETWSDQAHYQKVYGEFFGSSEVRIDNNNPAYGDVPYTLQTGKCGQPGQYIHITPEYVNTVTSGKEHVFGPTDRLIVHEWAHLRYGIFDEYGTAGDPEFPIFYLEGGKVRVSACSEDMKGWIETTDGEPCRIDNDVFSSNCRFIPDTSNANVTASLMSFNYLPGVTEFCEKSSNGARKHNSRAPTKQNRYCDKSAWEVITNHEDFESMNSINNEQYVAPNFRIVRPSPREQRFVFVLDISGSMQAGSRIILLHQACVKLIEDTIPIDSYIGIVTYESTARIVQPMTKIADSNRKTVSDKVPKRADGGTAMGQGLQTALRVLQDTKQSTEGAVFILVSDGEENVEPYSGKILPEIKSANVIVHTVAIGADASSQLMKIADETGGKSYYFKDNSGSTHLDGILESTVEQQLDVDLKKEQLIREELSVSSTIEKRVTIDHELGNNTIFTISGNIQSVQLEAYGPKGERYNHTSPGYNKDTGTKSRIQLHLPFAEPGEWILKLVKSDSSAVKIDVSVTSEAQNIANQPLRVISYLGDELVKYPEVGAIYARLTKGNKIVIRATVIATVSRPNAAPVQVQLTDDGTGADFRKNDGIYSKFFTRYTANGRYSFSIAVTNSNRSARAIIPKFSGISPLPIRSKSGKLLNVDPTNEFDTKLFVKVGQNDVDEDDEEQGEEIGDIVRDQEGTGVLTVTDHGNVDKMPPNKVTDLKVIKSEVTKKGEMMFTLEWTSPGDNMDDGNATSLEIRLSINGENLKQDKFHTALELKETHLVEGTLVPMPGREKHRIVVKLPEEFISSIKQDQKGSKEVYDIYIAIRASDANKNVAEISNIVSLHFGYEIPEKVDPPTPEPEAKKETVCKKRRISNKLLLSLIVDLDNIEEI